MSGGLLRGRDLHLLVGSVGVSALGDWLALTPLALHVQGETGSGVLVATLFVAVWFPAVLLAVPAGALVDRFETRRLLAAVSLAQAGVALGLAFVDSTAAILVLAALLGSGFALAQPAEFALVPAVAGAERIARANGYVETSRYVGFTVGPVLGGLLAAGGGTRVALLVNAASFLGVASAALLIRVDRRPERAPEKTEEGRALGGLGYLFRDRVLGLVMAVAFASLLFMTASATAELFFAVEVLEIGQAGYGALLTSWTLAMALGALVFARRVPRAAVVLVALVAVVVQSVGVGGPTLWLVAPFAFASFFVGGLAHGIKNVLIRTLIHERVAERAHGRAYAAYNALRNGAELVALMLGGVLVATIGARWTLFLAGAAPALAGLVGLAAYARMRRRAPEAGPAVEPA